jgi:hypothetical protein
MFLAIPFHQSRIQDHMPFRRANGRGMTVQDNNVCSTYGSAMVIPA